MLGLVLEGGASRTVFTCGVLDALLENDIIADYVIGTSAGISYGVSYCSGQKGRNREITERFMNDKRYMGSSHMFKKNNRSYYNLDFVFDKIPNKHIPFDYENFSKFKGEVIAVATNIKTGEAEYLSVEPSDKKFMVLRASCAMPILFKAIEIGDKKYLDGGVADSVPFLKAIEKGCDKNLVILTHPRGYIREKERINFLIKPIYRKYSNFTKKFLNRHLEYNESMRTLERLEEEGKVFIIAPSDTGGISRTEKRPQILLPYNDKGYDFANSMMNEIKEYIGK